MDVKILIQNGPNTVYEPVLSGSATWETQRRGQPGKLTFSMLQDSMLKVEEGNAVRLDVDGKPLFFGYIFERSWGKDGQVNVTAYDQLRYLKNKKSYQYENLKASDVIRMIAGDFNLNVGELEEPDHIIEYRTENNKALFDIILNALDLTMLATNNMYILYDDAGWLTLKNINNMKLSVGMDDAAAEDYSYKISIDSNTYNQIYLYRDNQETQKREVYMTKNTENINKWGILQYDASINSGVNGQEAAESYLSLYNAPTKSLSIKNAFGDVRVRAGCMIPVFLDVKDMNLHNYLIVESVKHSFNEGLHTMDLTLKGAGINA